MLGYLLFNPAFTTKGRDRDDGVDVFANLNTIAFSLWRKGRMEGRFG